MSAGRTELARIYDRAWFDHDFRELRPDFGIVALAIYRQFHPRSVLDIGCGPGLLMDGLHALGVEVEGIDGSVHALEYAATHYPRVRESIIHEDLRQIPSLRAIGVGHPDLVICTEVLEHIEEEKAEHVVSLLCEKLCPIIVTAAPPGQDGHHHVNCQRETYWDHLFATRGVMCDIAATDELQRRWSALARLSHMTKNVRVYR